MRLAALLLSMLSLSTAIQGAATKVRISAWYWLNSAPRSDWEGDFVTMHNLGFTDVVLCWGIDSAAFGKRIDDSRYAMEMAHKAGIGAYILLWHPYANSLERNPKYMQVDSAGRLLPTFDVFNPEWRNTEWKHYVQTVAKSYGNEPSMAGYVFDDSFQVDGTGIVSYGEYERTHFGHELPRKPADPYWKEWRDIRTQWWEHWARDTTHFIREIDPNLQHLIYLEDIAGQILNANLNDTVGVDFARVSHHFDAVGGYTFSNWDASPGSGLKMAEQAQKVLADLRSVLGPNQLIIYTFWVANNGKNVPRPAQYPTADQIRLVCQAALKSGIRYLDMYGFRIGQSGVRLEDFSGKAPGTESTYPLTGQIPQVFLWDRPEIHDSLKNYLISLNER